jgi:vacuolar-type H+-ATPase subunit F/Vma7
MIVLATEELATGLKLAGVKESYHITGKQQAEEIIKTISQKEFIIATQKIIELAPILEEYPNLITFPDTIHDFSNIDDLRKIVKKAIGSEVDI